MAASVAKVTIGVPVHNGEPYLRTALDNLLAQTYQDFEIVICDNGSRDRTAAISAEYQRRDPRIRYVRHEKVVPPVGSFMRTLAEARGDYFLWAAVDDSRPQQAVAALVAALDAAPDAVMAHGPVVADLVREQRTVVIAHRMDLSDADPAARTRRFTREMQYNGMLYGLYRTAAVRQAFFRQHPGHDYLMCLQMCLLGPLAYTPTPMLTYRHVWGETDTPMYRLERVTLRDLLLYRGVRRHKCWLTLLVGTFQLLSRRRVGRLDRVRSAAAHVGGFVRRYPRHLTVELLFIAFTPAMRAAQPFAPAGRRFKRRLALRTGVSPF